MENKKTIKKGSSDFKTIIEDNGYFVDKSMLIKDFYEDSSYTLLITRPKRFGKTLNLSMIEYFFDIQKPECAKLFSQFAIATEKKFCREHQNKYPVINISLKSVKETDWEKCLYRFKSIISDLYKSFKYLLQSEKFDSDEIAYFKGIVSKNANETDYKAALLKLSQYLQNHYQKNVIILVDEYDAPIISAFQYTKPPIKAFQSGKLTFYENVINFMQGFLGDAFKGNDTIKKGLLTGVMRIGRESIFSEWNNFDVFGITSHYYSEMFGFTQSEINKLLSYFQLEGKNQEVERWYDGYKFGSSEKIYNPWSIVNYIAKSKDGFRPYWVNSGDYSLIKSRIIEIGVNKNIQDLIEGKCIEKELFDNFVFQDFETNSELLWTLLTDNGYLTQAGDGDFGSYKLRIPNNEVKIVFTNIIKTWINNEVKLTRDLLTYTAKNLINNSLIDFENGFKQIVGDTLSYFDTVKHSDNQNKKNTITQEQIYHVYTLGLLTILTDDYIIKSNRESGEGRYDIMLIPHDKTQRGIIIEIKSIVKRKENEVEKRFIERINREIDKALGQIDRNEYYKELLENKITPQNIIKIPIVFVGKTPYINKLESKKSG